MIQMTFTNRKTKREEFLDAMDEIILWSYWVEMILLYYFNKKMRPHAYWSFNRALHVSNAGLVQFIR